MSNVTKLLENAAGGDANSLNQFYDLVYAELRAIAARKMAAERAGHTLQPTALVSPNAVKTQIWIAISIYVLLAIVRKQLGLELDLYPMSQILSLTLFEKMPLLQAFSQINCQNELDLFSNQLDLFDL